MPQPVPDPVPGYHPASEALVEQARREALLGDEARAGATLERALRIDADNPWIWIELGHLRLEAGHVAAAQSMARKALSLSSLDAWRARGGRDGCCSRPGAAREPGGAHRRGLRRERCAAALDRGVSAPRRPAPHGASGRRGARGAQYPVGRGGHRHGQDLRLSRAGARRRAQGRGLHRHQDAAGPAVPARLAGAFGRAWAPGARGAPEGARKLPVPSPARARDRRGRRGARYRAAGEDPGLGRRHGARRDCRGAGHPGGCAGLGAGDLERRQLPWAGVP
jgi:hypothetical protein